jgi:hypothetical protein
LRIRDGLHIGDFNVLAVLREIKEGLEAREILNDFLQSVVVFVALNAIALQVNLASKDFLNVVNLLLNYLFIGLVLEHVVLQNIR